MAVADAVDQLPDYLLDQIQRAVACVLLDHVQDGQLAVVEDQVEAPFAPEDLDQVDEVRVSELAQHADLAHCNPPDDGIGVVLRVALDRNNLASLPVDALEHDALGCAGGGVG